MFIIYYLPSFYLEHLLVDIFFSVFTFYLFSLRQGHGEDLRNSRRIRSSSSVTIKRYYKVDRTKMLRKEKRRKRKEFEKRKQDRDRSLRRRGEIREQEQAARNRRLAAKGLPQDGIAEDEDFDEIINEHKEKMKTECPVANVSSDVRIEVPQSSTT